MLQAAEKDIHAQLKRGEKTAADEELSIRQLLAQHESAPIITDPREYQIELFERAKERNTIAVLDTGSGKTLIAVLLLRHVIDQELEDRRQGKPPRIAFFLVPSVTLVFQQFAVLERNLEHNVERFCGAMKCDLWTRQTWVDHFAKNKIIVCTADVLHQCLMHSFISMRQINLLIFDEAHHAKKGHAYAQIIKDFYLHETDTKLRPRIFGMTASPVDAKVDIMEAASQLEDILCSSIATTANMSLLQKTIVRPHEQILRYLPGQPQSLESDFFREISTRFGDITVIKPLFDRAKYINTHLGRWCSDYYWTFALADKKVQKLESKIERRSNSTTSAETFQQVNAEIEQMKDAIDFVFKHKYPSPCLQAPDVSHKLLSLHNYLSLYFERPSDHRCIVFVEQRVNARLLHELFMRTGGAHLRPGVLTGSGSGRLDDVQATFRNQVVTLMKFRKGELNCLFATSVAEEGLDVPDCNLIIRFDICKTMIQYIQSRGRARHKNSKFIHMLETNNSIHDRTLQDNRVSEQLMRNFCEALPADRRLDTDYALDDALQCNESTSFTIPGTGAKITFASSLQLIGHFVSCLPKDGEEILQPVYIPTSYAGKYICELILPDKSPITRVMGKLSNRKTLAKRSAAYEACVQLVKKKYLDHNLVPIYTKKLPLMRNAALALGMKKAGSHNMRLKPKVWEAGRGTIPTELYLTLFDVSGALDRPHKPLMLVTRTPMPAFPEFPLFLGQGRRTMVKTFSSSAAVNICHDQLDQLTNFTLRIFKDMFNKTYEFDTSKMSYWLAPTTGATSGVPVSKDLEALVDWAVVDFVHSNEDFEWTPEMPDSFLVDKFLIDQWDGGRRFFSTRLAPEYKPTDPVPENTASGKWNANILDYTISLWAKARAERSWDLQQPVIEAEKALHRRNILAEPDDKELRLKTRCFLCPQPLKISALPPDIMAMCYVFPAIIHRIESYLIAAEAASFMGLRLDLSLALEAITKDSDNSEDDQNPEKINFQRGMGKNYERLEFLGDCFLKMATSISVFTQNPNDNEFDFHVKRMLLLCNKNLFNVAQKLKLYEYIRSLSFSRRTWYPTGLKLLKGKGSKRDAEEEFKQHLGDKTIADVCEALMGAAFLTHNQPGAWQPQQWTDVVMAVTKLVDSSDHAMTEWRDYSKVYDKPAYQVAEASGAQLELARKTEEKHDYRFKYPRLLQSAFTHPSLPFTWSNIPSYQRLEFLGDSLLDMACVSHIFYRYPDKDPQWLTEHKMAMVSNKFLGAVCVQLGFHRSLRQNSSIIMAQITEYADELQNAVAIAHGAKDFWTSVKDPPKVCIRASVGTSRDMC